MKHFEFLKTPKIIFGDGEIARIGKIACQYGSKTLLIHGKHSFKSGPFGDAVFKSLADAGVSCFEFEVSGEPTPSLIDSAVQQFGNTPIHSVIAIGGGSVLDSGKAISAMLPEHGQVIDYLEIIGNTTPNGKKIPFIAVPTTSGTGSEATANAVISRIGINGFKCSLRHTNYIPDIALVDPRLSLQCPPDITAACGMDALTQLIESYVSTKASPVTDSLVEKALPLAGAHLVNAFKNGATDINARTGMAYASLISGITLANAGLGVVHGLASILGAAYPIPHGVACGTLLAAATKCSINKLQQSASGSAGLTKYASAARLLTGKALPDTAEACRALIDYLENLTQVLEIKMLSDYGIKNEHFYFLLNDNNCNKNNPVQLTQNEIMEFLTYRTV